MPSEDINNNKFLRVLLAARRAKQLINGDKKRIEIKADNPLTVALEEIRQDKINFNDILHTPLFFERIPEPEEAEILAVEEPLAELLADESEEESKEGEAKAVEAD